MVVVPGGEPCACGQSGCLEAYASGSAIERRYMTATGRRGIGAEQVSRGMDLHARRIWGEATDLLGAALAHSTCLLDPGTIVFGGGVSRAGDRLLNPVRQALSSRLRWRAAPQLAVSTLTSHAGLRGAVIQAWHLADGEPS